LQFIDGGDALFVGGMGYLNLYTRTNGKYVKSISLETALRDFIYNERQQVILANRGLHGLELIRRGRSAFQVVGSVQTRKPVESLAVAPEFDHCATIAKVAPSEAGSVELYAIRI